MPKNIMTILRDSFSKRRIIRVGAYLGAVGDSNGDKSTTGREA